MAKSIKKGLMVLLTCALVFFGAAAMFFAENAVYAEASVNMQYGASVRIRGDGTGIRFTAFVDESLLDINEEGASFKQDVTVGMIVVPAKVLENAVGDVIAYIGSSFNKEKSEFAYEFSDEQIRKITEATENGSVTKYAVSAAIVNITDSNVNLEYQAVPYVFDGENYTYGDMSEKRTISYVLESALKSDGYSDEQKNIILGETIRIHNEQAMTLTTDSSIENGCDLSAFASSDKVIDSALVGETAVTVKENKISGEYLAPGDNEIKITYADGSKITLSTDTDPVMRHAETEYKTASSSQFFEKAYAQRVTSGYIAKYRIKSAGLASSDKTSGNVTYFNTWTNTDGSGTYKTNYGVMLMFDGNGLKLYGWSNSGWVNRNYYFTAEQKTVMSENGIDMIFTFDGTEFAVWVATSSAEMKKVMIAPVSETIYVVGHKGEVYSGNPDITVSEDVYNCKGQTAVQSITGLYGNLYTTVNDSFIYLLNSKAETKFENLSSNSEFESAYAAPRPNEGYFARYTVKSSDLATSSSTSGNVIYFNTWTNTDGSAWTANNSVNYGVMLMFDGNGLKLYGWSNSGWVNRNYYFTAEQLSMFGADGIDVITAHDGKTFKVYVEVSDGVIYEVMEAPAEGRYIVAHKHAVYTGHDLSVSLEAYGYTGYTLETALGEVYSDKYEITSENPWDSFENLHHADATEYKTASASQFFEKAYAQRVTSGYIAKYRIKSAGLASSDKTSGNVTYFNTWTNTDGSGTYKTNYGVMLMFDGNGLKLYGWSNSGWVNRNYYFTAEQKTVMSENGIDMIFTFDGTEFAVWVATSSAEMKKVMIAPVSETIYVVGHKGEVYSGNPDITVSEDVYNCKGQTAVQSITGLYGNLYTTVNDSFIYLLNSKAETKFENLSSNSEFESAYAAPRPNEGYFARYTVKSSDLATSSSTSGNVIYFNTWTNTDGSAWTANNSVNYGVMLMFDGNGLKLYGWSNSGWVNRNYYFTAEQLSMFGADGIDVITAHDGKTFKVYVEVSDGVIYEVMEAPAEGRYIVAHKHAVYTGHDLSVSLETYGYIGYTLESALEEVYLGKYEITSKDPHQNN